MISQIGIVSLLSVLAAISFPVLCQQTDSKPIKIIDLGFRCTVNKVSGVIFSETSRGGVKSQAGLRACMLPSECNLTLSMSRHDEYFRKVILCCEGRDCHLTRSEFQQRIGSSQPNGLICPSCSSDRSTRCCTSDTIQCTGDETMCAYRSAKTSGLYPSSDRGCSTQAFCDHGNFSSKSWETLSLQRTICTKAQETINVNQLQPLCVP